MIDLDDLFFQVRSLGSISMLDLLRDVAMATK